MSGVFYSRDPAIENPAAHGDSTEPPIHLWKHADGEDGKMRTACGEVTAEIIETGNSGMKIRGDGGNETGLPVVQKEAFNQRNSGYCDECLEQHPKVDN